MVTVKKADNPATSYTNIEKVATNPNLYVYTHI